MNSETKKKIRVGFLLEMPRSGGGSFQWMMNILDALTAHQEIEVYVYHKKNYENLEEIQSRYPSLSYICINNLSRIAKAIYKRLFFVAPYLVARMPFLLATNFYFKKNKLNLLVLPTLFIDAVACSVPTIFFLADIGHRTHPEFPELTSGFEGYRREKLIKHGLKNALTIVVESTQLKKDVVSIYGVEQNKIFVIPQCLGRNRVAIDHENSIKEGYSYLPPLQKYFFYPAQLWPHKNHLNLLRAFKEISLADDDIYLVLTGTRKTGDVVIFDEIRALGLDDKVKYFGYVSDIEVENLYKNAIALIMPTFLGPTNIPTLEAFHYGCPALISDLPGVFEQAGDAVLYFNPSSISEIKNAMQTVIDNPHLRCEMIKKGKQRVNEFYYDSYMKHFHSVLDKTLGRIKSSIL